MREFRENNAVFRDGDSVELDCVWEIMIDDWEIAFSDGTNT